MEEIIGEYRQFLQSIIDEYPFSKGNTASEMKARCERRLYFRIHRSDGPDKRKNNTHTAHKAGCG